ncbi:MAG: ABC transporter ATP-binding protein [Anaerolineaceae bacterium]|nr:ABC transporter ATP-binding protein [Anaerolineaceae bacterium]
MSFTQKNVDARSLVGRAGGGRSQKIERACDPKKALKRLAGNLKPYRLQLVFVALLVLGTTLLSLVGPYLLGRAIDHFIAHQDRVGLVRSALLMLVSYLGTMLFQVRANQLMAKISQFALKDLRRDLFAHLQTLPMQFFDSHTAGGLMSRLTNDIDAINQAISQNVVTMMASALQMAGILIMMFALNPALALFTLLVVPLMLAFTRFIASYTAKGYRELQKSLGQLNAITEETFSGQKVIKAFQRNQSVIEQFNAINEEVYQAGVYANSYALLLLPVTMVLANFFVAVLAGGGAWLALRGLVSIGMIATFINYGQNFVTPLRKVANLYNSVLAALAGAERVYEMMDTPPEPADEREPLPFEEVQGQVSFKHVSFGYDPARPVIRDFNLEVKAGQTIALVGPTGAGKTTITNLLTRFYEIQEGQICIDGKDIRRLRKSDLRRQLGLVLQDTFLFAESVMENIRFGRLEASDEECMAAARQTEADRFIQRFAEGYQTNLLERASNISLGQRQLLSITRAILADPKILILDEATSSVDTRTEARIQTALLKLMKNRTSFVIAHRLSTIRDADLVVVIDQGRIVETGSHDALLAKKGFYHHLYLSQFKGQQI